MGTIAFILTTFKGRGYEQIIAKRLLERLTNRFPSDITGKITSRTTAESYISNCAQLSIIARAGGYLRLTSKGEVLLCLADFAKFPPPFKLSCLEKAFFINQLIRLDKPCFYALLKHLGELGKASLKRISQTVDYPTYSRLKIGARIHRIGARIEWAVDLGLVEKKESSYYLSKSGKRFLLSINSNSWDIITTTLFEKTLEKTPSYEWFLKNLVESYSILAHQNPFDVFVKLASIRLYMRLRALPHWNLDEKIFGRLFLETWKRNSGKIQLLRSMKKENPEDAVVVNENQYKYVYIK